MQISRKTHTACKTEEAESNFVTFHSRRDVPLTNYRMHTLHCARNVVLCKECGEPVPR